MPQSTRALIIGGGIAGPVLAMFLKKSGFDVQVFEAHSPNSEAGGGLSIAPNGMNVLAALGLAEPLRSVSVMAGDAIFENQRGKRLARMPLGDASRYGHAPAFTTRAALHRVLLEHADSQGILIHFDKRLISVEDRATRPISVVFEDGTRAEGDFLIGADGIRSQVRQQVLPDAPRPAYTGLMAPGGFSPVGQVSYGPRSTEPAHFIFGQNGFFGYFNGVTTQGPRAIWWSTVAAPLDSRETMAAITQADLKQRLLAVHGSWADPVPQLIRSADEILNVAIHDVPSLPRWSSGRTLLIGDAAHAVAPHSGQGASMALEDAMFLAKLLRDSSGAACEQVFAHFEQERRPRTDKVIALGRRNAQRKERMSVISYWFMQQMIRVFVPLSSKQSQDWLLGYKID